MTLDDRAHKYLPPTDELFGDDDYMEAPSLKGLAQLVIAKYLPELNDGVLDVYFAWKRLGGTSGGNATLGKCVKVTGLTKHFASDYHFVIWLAADHVVDFMLDDDEIEAIVFHELKHIEVLEEGEYRVRGHDIELFVQEVELYGHVESRLKPLIEVVQKLDRRVSAMTGRPFRVD